MQVGVAATLGAAPTCADEDISTGGVRPSADGGSAMPTTLEELFAGCTVVDSAELAAIIGVLQEEGIDVTTLKGLLQQGFNAMMDFFRNHMKYSLGISLGLTTSASRNLRQRPAPPERDTSRRTS